MSHTWTIISYSDSSERIRKGPITAASVSQDLPFVFQVYLVSKSNVLNKSKNILNLTTSKRTVADIRDQ